MVYFKVFIGPSVLSMRNKQVHFGVVQNVSQSIVLDGITGGSAWVGRKDSRVQRIEKGLHEAVISPSVR